ncbi:v-type ATP synthase beta chain [Striga asiatica]|uniref:V-type ATP synthase beta chain n=1 Tax=Striga asiatica TaxID=4170 RepID=A0A5A7PUC5_STRAF|nr:v-type ATP synthase beta chain [Striga asiatica]
MSASSIKRSLPTWASISAWAFFRACGWLRRRDSAHSSVPADVSVPAINRFCHTHIICIILGLRFLQRQQHLNHSFGLPTAGGPSPPFFHQSLHKTVPLCLQLNHLLLAAAQPQPPHHRQKIPRARRRHPQRLLRDLPELPRLLGVLHVLPIVSLPGDHPHHHVHGQLEEGGLHVDRRSRGPSAQGPDRGSELVDPDLVKRLELVAGEDLDRGNPAQVPPVVAVGGPDERGVVVAEVFAGEQAGTVGEDDIVSGEAVLGGGGGRDDENGAGAEVEEGDGAIAVGDLS